MDASKRRTLTIATVSVIGVLVAVIIAQAFYIGLITGQQSRNAPNESVVAPNVRAMPPSGQDQDAAQSDPRADTSLPPLAFDPDTWDPFDEMERMQEQMNSMFDDAFGRFGQSPRFRDLLRGHSFNPQVDLTEQNDAYIVRVDIPGTDQSSIRTEVEDRTLTISGTRDESVREERDDGSLFRFERQLGRFTRQVTLPGPVDAVGIETEYEEGVLTVRIPKARAGTLDPSV